MSEYAIGDGRVKFIVENLFEISQTLTGPEDTDYWYAVDLRLLGKAEENIVGMSGEAWAQKNVIIAS